MKTQARVSSVPHGSAWQFVVEVLRAAVSGSSKARRLVEAQTPVFHSSPSSASASDRGGETFFCVSGLAALEHIAAAMPRSASAQPPSPRPAASVADASDSLREEAAAFPGVWYSRGRVHGQVNLARAPQRGWFEIFVPKSL